jgi:glycerate kinase
LIKDAIDKGAEKIILGIGGSATNDGGIGILAALGFQFIDQRNDLLSPVGENLININKIIPPGFLPDIKIEIACDVQNILFGPQGAAHIYAPQKGADEKAVRLLDDGLKNLAEIIQKQTGKDVATIPGTGAAGGIAAGLMAFFDVTLLKGTDIVTAASGIENEIQNSDFIITGEGKMDKQTLDGKVVSTIAGLAQRRSVPVIAFCGIQEEGDILRKELNIIHIESLVSGTISKVQAMKNAREILERKSEIVFNEILKPFMKA